MELTRTIHARRLPRSLTTSILVVASALATGSRTVAQSVLFDFDNAPLHSSLPVDLTVGGVTAHLSATGQGFSIQDTSAPVVPAGFTGRFLYPNSVFAADLAVTFSRKLTAFSIEYSPQELGCDDSATMRVTAFMNGTFVGTQTATVGQPGTWPVGTLSCNFAQGFNGVVVHYDRRPPTCQDYGPIFLADNMIVVPAPSDTTPPVLTFPAAVNALAPKSGASGAVVYFSVSATDDTDPNPSVLCVPPSGSFFPLGTTTVTCTATDASGNQSVGTFPVAVRPPFRASRR